MGGWCPVLALGLVAALAAGGTAQGGPAPDAGRGLGTAAADALAAVAQRHLDAEDPVAALDAYRALRRRDPGHVEALLGLGRCHLLLGRPELALRYADAYLAARPGVDAAEGLAVEALIRARRFEAAVARSRAAVAARAEPSAALLAAHASALFRVQENTAAAAAYREVLRREPDHPQANLRLGSGLSEPLDVEIGDGLQAASSDLRGRRLASARQRLHGYLAAEPGHPVAHRLLGEALYLERASRSMALASPVIARVADLASRADPADLPIDPASFLGGYGDLDGSRRPVADRALALFGSRLPRLLAIGGRHDLLGELERTTDDTSRRFLRGKRTFDGRVWDDVRGMGGLQAATGIESLDEAGQFGFDTLVHEVAHQVHLYALRRVDRLRIRRLYHEAREADRFLDYYAAVNETEYFAQGVEAFVSLVKRPGREVTHGHTRFELMRVDPALHRLIAGLVDFDPLRDAADREALLEACGEAALLVGRPTDAEVAAALMAPSPSRDRLRERAARAVRRAKSW